MNASTIAVQHQDHLNPHPQINQLLSTADTGTGIIGDVDALLTPIKPKPTSSAGANVRQLLTQRLEPRAERNLWHVDEIMQMLTVMQNMGAMDLLNDKSVKSDTIFHNVEKLMQKSGYRRKSHVQIRTKWKFLKSTYNTSHRNGAIPKMISSQVYQELHKMLSGSGSIGSACSAASSDCGNSTDGGDLIIAGVEGGYANSQVLPDETSGVLKSATEMNSFEHPIFGYRLGLVKQEPTDAGYETNAENTALNIFGEKSRDPLEGNSSTTNTSQIQFRTEIKEEPLEVCDVVQRNRKLMSPLPNARNVDVMPPLRVAPFAKESLANVFEQQLLDRPPPPLSMHPTNTTVRPSKPLNRVNLSEHAKATMRRLPPQSRLNSSAPLIPAPSFTPIHLTKEITLQARLPSQHPKTMAFSRKTRPNMAPPPYSLNDNSNNKYSRSSSKSGYDMCVTALPPRTSRSQPPSSTAPFSLPVRKRRLDVPLPEPPVKFNRSQVNYSGHKPNTMPRMPVNFNTTNTSGCQSTQQQHESHCHQPIDLDRHKKYETEFFDNALKTLGTSLRQMQRDMLSEFFANQIGLARKEHEFQIHQDLLLMQAFGEQTQQLMQSASELLNMEVSISQMEQDTNKRHGEDEADAEAEPNDEDECEYEDGIQQQAQQVMNENKTEQVDSHCSSEVGQDDEEEEQIIQHTYSPCNERISTHAIYMHELKNEEIVEDTEASEYYHGNNNQANGEEDETDEENRDNEDDNNNNESEEGSEESGDNDDNDDDDDNDNNDSSSDDDENGDDENNEGAESEKLQDIHLNERYECEATESYCGSDMNAFHSQNENERIDTTEEDEVIRFAEESIDGSS